MNDSNSLAHTKWNCKYHGGVCTKISEKGILQREKKRNWCRGFYVDTAGKNAKKIQEYIQQQYEKDKAGEQLTMPNF